MLLTRMRRPIAFALLAAAGALAAAFAARSPSPHRAAAQSDAIRLAPASQPGIELVGVEAADADTGVPGLVRLTFRNVSGRPINSFSYARGASSGPQVYAGSVRSFNDGIEDNSWAPGAETVKTEEGAGDPLIRITAIEFADGEIVGEERPASSLRETRRAAADGLAEVLADVRARLARAGADPPARAQALRELRAEVGRHTGKGRERAPGTPIVISGRKSKVYLAVESTLERLAREVGEEQALEALAGALEGAVRRKSVGR